MKTLLVVFAILTVASGWRLDNICVVYDVTYAAVISELETCQSYTRVFESANAGLETNCSLSSGIIELCMNVLEAAVKHRAIANHFECDTRITDESIVTVLGELVRVMTPCIERYGESISNWEDDTWTDLMSHEAEAWTTLQQKTHTPTDDDQCGLLCLTKRVIGYIAERHRKILESVFARLFG